MYTTKAEDLTRIANDLDLLARKYGDGAEQLDQQMAGLDGATQQLISGGPEHWLGVSSEAFQAAWEERRARLQQISQILSQSAQHFTQFARTIEDNLPTIRADQAVMQESASHMLGVDDQTSLLNEESQAQNAIITALAMLNSQLEMLAEEVKDCPQEREGGAPGYGGPQDVNKSESGGNEGEQGSGNPPLTNVDQAQIDSAKFEKYSMDPDNPNNRTKRDDPNTGKWVAFRDVGYDVSTPESRAAGAQDIMN